MDWFYNSVFFLNPYPSLLYLVFFFALAGTAGISLALFYHWSRYSVGIISVVSAMFLYSFGVIVFLGGMLLVLVGT